MKGYRTLADHRSMAFDAVRNAAYVHALRRVVDSRSVVLDVGAGTGILGIAAARLGARRVFLVEPEPVIDVAAEIASANGLSDVVRCWPGRIEDVELPEPATVLV